VRAALISIAGQPRGAVAGKTLARRQLDFALAAGCESVIALGDGASAEAIGLRHAAEAGGARFQAIRDSHGLLGAIRADDELLVLAPGLLPEAPAALEALGKGKAVLVLPAGAGVAAGFERIDLERAWAGALVVGGAHVERLADLAGDIDPASALVRIALQARVPEKALPEAALADGSWTMLAEGGAASDAAWLDRHLPAASRFDATRRLAISALKPAASRLLAAGRAVEALAAGALAALAGAVVLAGFGFAAPGLALVALAALLVQATMALAELRRAPFGAASRRFGAPAVLPCLVDAALVACAVLAIDGSWPHRLFPPVVMLGALLALGRAEGCPALAGDRGLLALLLAAGTAAGFAEPAVMLVALALLALDLAQSRARGG